MDEPSDPRQQHDREQESIQFLWLGASVRVSARLGDTRLHRISEQSGSGMIFYDSDSDDDEGKNKEPDLELGNEAKSTKSNGGSLDGERAADKYTAATGGIVGGAVGRAIAAGLGYGVKKGMNADDSNIDSTEQVLMNSRAAKSTKAASQSTKAAWQSTKETSQTTTAALQSNKAVSQSTKAASQSKKAARQSPMAILQSTKAASQSTMTALQSIKVESHSTQMSSAKVAELDAVSEDGHGDMVSGLKQGAKKWLKVNDNNTESTEQGIFIAAKVTE